MKRFMIHWTDHEGKVWSVGGMQGIEAASMKMAAQMFWIMWTTDVMPAKVVIEEM